MTTETSGETSEFVTTAEAADILDVSHNYVRIITKKYGVRLSHMAKNVNRRDLAMWRRVDIEQIAYERKRQEKLDAERLGLGPRIDISDIPGPTPYEEGLCASLWPRLGARVRPGTTAGERAERRERLSEQLDNAPVTAADLDYIASRSGERRARVARTYGATAHILAGEKAKG